MHKDDQMTPKERLAGFFSNKPIDRIINTIRSIFLFFIVTTVLLYVN